MRDPVDRLISAFNWRSPQQCLQRRLAADSRRRRLLASDDGCGAGWQHPRGYDKGFYECFKDVEQFVEAILDKGKHSAKCRTYAQVMKRANDGAAASSSHVRTGLVWYVGQVIAALVRRPSDVWIVRTETCGRDVAGAIRWARGEDPARGEDGLEKPKNPTHHHSRNMTAGIVTDIDPIRRKQLRREPWMQLEYQMLDLLLDASVNYGPNRTRRDGCEGG